MTQTTDEPDLLGVGLTPFFWSSPGLRAVLVWPDLSHLRPALRGALSAFPCPPFSTWTLTRLCPMDGVSRTLSSGGIALAVSPPFPACVGQRPASHLPPRPGACRSGTRSC